jgi:hypothetical protein
VIETDPMKTPTQEMPAHPPGSGLGIAVALTLGAGFFSAAMTWMLLRRDLSTAWAELTAALALAAFGVAVYGFLRTLLVLVESAGDRRRQTREITERRTGDRARKPPQP